MRQLDIEMAKICSWLKAHGLTAHVTLAGELTLRRKALGKPADAATSGAH